MKLLVSLIDAVVAEILTSWLEVSDITRLDSAAYCGDTRRAMLACLYSATTVYKTAQLLKDFNHRTADGYTRWQFSRNVCVDGIYISRSFLRQHDQRTLYLQRCGKSITTICAEEIYPANCNPPTPTESLCRLCPNIVDITCPHDFKLADYHAVAQTWPHLTSIVFTIGASAEALLAIARCCRQLVHVKLENYVTRKAKAEFILALPYTIETIDLGGARYFDLSPTSEAAIALSPTAVFQTANLPRLQYVTGEFMREQTDETVLTIAQRCNIQTFEICGSDSLSEAAYGTLSRYCKLQELRVTEGDRIGSDVLVALSQGCAPTLRKFSIDGGGCTTEVLHAIGKHCINLEELFVRDTWGTQPSEGWEVVARGCPKLHTLTTLGGVLTEDGLCAMVEFCRELRSITIDGSVVSDRAVYAIAQHCRELHTLEVSSKGDVSDDSLCAVARAFPCLHTLVLGVSCSDATLLALAEHCTDLKCLYLNSPDSAHMRVTDVGVTALVTHCTKLRVLSLVEADITDAILPIIADSCRLLRELHVSDCMAISAPKARDHRLLLDADVLVDISNWYWE